MVSPAQRRELVAFFEESMQLSERLSCELAGLSRSVRRYESRREPDVELRVELKKLASQRRASAIDVLAFCCAAARGRQPTTSVAHLPRRGSRRAAQEAQARAAAPRETRLS